MVRWEMLGNRSSEFDEVSCMERWDVCMHVERNKCSRVDEVACMRCAHVEIINRSSRDQLIRYIGSEYFVYQLLIQLKLRIAL